MAGAIRWLGGLIMAGAVGSFLAVSTVNGDPRLASVVAFLIGAGLVVLGTLLARPVVIGRIPRLQPTAYKINAAHAVGTTLFDEIRDTAEDDPTRADVHARIRAWDIETRRMLTGIGRANFYPREEFVADTSSWRQPAMNFIQVRLDRLADLLREQH